MRFPLHSIKAKLLSVFLVFGMVPFLLISALTIRSLKNEIHQEVIDKLLLFVDAKTQEVLMYFNLLENRTSDFASDGVIQHYMVLLQDDSDQEELEAFHQYLLEQKMPVDSNLTDIIFFNKKGTIVAATNQTLIGLNKVAYEYFQKGSKELFIQEMDDPSLNQNQNVFSVSYPLRVRGTEEELGMIMNIFDAKSMESYFTGRLGLDDKGIYLLDPESLKSLEVYVVDANRNMLIRSHKMTIAAEDTQLAPIPVNTVPVQMCLEQEKPIGGLRYLNYAGQEVIGVSVCFPERDWVVISEIEAAYAFDALTTIYIRFAFIIALLFLSILLFALIISRRITEPLQIMTQAVRRAQEGDLDVRIPIESNDEISQFASAFNVMAERLKRMYSSLEKKVKEKTEKLRERILITEQERAKDEAILQSVGDGLIVTDAKGKILIANSAAQYILGLENRPIHGDDLAMILPLQDEEGKNVSLAGHPIRLAFTQSKKTEGIYYFLSPGLAKFPIRITITPVIFNKNNIGVIMVFRDVTKEKEVDRMKNEFVSLVSHQLRTPLSGMKWFAEILRAGDVGQLNGQQKEFIDNINELNERMIALVNALLNISRIESGRIIIDPQPTRLKDLMDDVLKTFHVKINAKNLTLVMSINEHLPIIKIDSKLIREAYSNLISNAIKYTPNGGEITIFISENDQEIVSQITDTGYGIPQAEQEKVFRKFYRGSNIVAVETDGNGLGLYLVKAIVESSGGRIWFKSAEGKGTSFFFSLPRKGSKAKKGEVAITP